MRAPTTLGEFLDVLFQSPIALADRPLVNLTEADHQSNPRDFALALVSLRLLTRYQAKQLLAGEIDRLKVGKYTVLDNFSRHDGYQVLLAYEPTFRRRVVIKSLAPSMRNDPSCQKHFHRETEVAGKLQDATYVRVFDVDNGPDESDRFLIREFVPGSIIDDVIRTTRFELGHARYLSASLAEGLLCAKLAGVTDRWVPHHHLLLEPHGALRILSLGSSLCDRHANSSPSDAEQTAGLLCRLVTGRPFYWTTQGQRGQKVLEIAQSLDSECGKWVARILDASDDEPAVRGLIDDLRAGAEPPMFPENPIDQLLFHPTLLGEDPADDVFAALPPTVAEYARDLATTKARGHGFDNVSESADPQTNAYRGIRSDRNRPTPPRPASEFEIAGESMWDSEFDLGINDDPLETALRGEVVLPTEVKSRTPFPKVRKSPGNLPAVDPSGPLSSPSQPASSTRMSRDRTSESSVIRSKAPGCVAPTRDLVERDDDKLKSVPPPADVPAPVSKSSENTNAPSTSALADIQPTPPPATAPQVSTGFETASFAQATTTVKYSPADGLDFDSPPPLEESLKSALPRSSPSIKAEKPKDIIEEIFGADEEEVGYEPPPLPTRPAVIRKPDESPSQNVSSGDFTLDVPYEVTEQPQQKTSFAERPRPPKPKVESRASKAADDVLRAIVTGQPLKSRTDPSESGADSAPEAIPPTPTKKPRANLSKRVEFEKDYEYSWTISMGESNKFLILFFIGFMILACWLHMYVL